MRQGILIGVITQQQPEKVTLEYLDELEFLSKTYGITISKTFTQKLPRPDKTTYIGKGKLEETKLFVKENQITYAIFDDELSPSQIRNLEKYLGIKIIDRTGLILEIFSQRAQTAHAKAQVQLAQHQYLLPRLTGMWTHLERQRGGTGTRGGAGEKEIETDRRITRQKISQLKLELKHIDQQKATQRKNRGEYVRVALVGYTNVGKSTLMNLLTKSSVFVENKLFATLDTTVRKTSINQMAFLLSDTVGFIRKLPTQLVESFKSTLDEVREADILIHVVDISHPNYEDQIAVVQQTLKDIKADNKPTVLLFNKIDNYVVEQIDEYDLTQTTTKKNIEEVITHWGKQINSHCLGISAIQKKNLERFKDLIYTLTYDMYKVKYPYVDFKY